MTNEEYRTDENALRAWILVNQEYLDYMDTDDTPGQWLSVLILKFGLAQTAVGRARHPEAVHVISDTELGRIIGQSRQAARQLLNRAIHRLCWLKMRRIRLLDERLFPDELAHYF